MERKISKKNIVGIVFGCLSFNLILFIALIDHLLLFNNTSAASLITAKIFATFFAIAIGVPTLIFFFLSLGFTSSCKGFKQLPLVIAGVVLTAGVATSCWFGFHEYRITYESIPYAKYEAALDAIQKDGRAYLTIYSAYDTPASGYDEGAKLVDSIGNSNPVISESSHTFFNFSTGLKGIKYESMDGVYTVEINGRGYLKCTYNPLEEDKAIRKTYYEIETLEFDKLYSDAQSILGIE